MNETSIRAAKFFKIFKTFKVFKWIVLSLAVVLTAAASAGAAGGVPWERWLAFASDSDSLGLDAPRVAEIFGAPGSEGRDELIGARTSSYDIIGGGGRWRVESGKVYYLRRGGSDVVAGLKTAAASPWDEFSQAFRHASAGNFVSEGDNYVIARNGDALEIAVREGNGSAVYALDPELYEKFAAAGDLPELPTDCDPRYGA